MNFSQLQCFVALAEKGSFTEAAYAVNMTQSAVSHALAALESELRVTLIERNRKGVVALTSTGQRIIPRVRELLAQAEAIEQEAKDAHGVTEGKLRVGSILSLCPGLLASVLTRFQQQYPEIEVVLFEGTMVEVHEWINNSTIDVGFVVHPAKGIESKRIATDELCVLMPPNHRLSTQDAVPPNELSEEDFIMAKIGCSFQLMEMAGIDTSKVRPRLRYQATDSATILAMVREGLGVTVQPRMLLPQKLEGVIALPLDPPQQLPIGLAVRSQEKASPAARLFIKQAMTWTQEPASKLSPVR